MLNFLLNIIFPPTCIGCNKEDSWLCKECKNQIITTPKESFDDNIKLYIACAKSPILKKLVYQYKYSFKKIYKDYIGELLLICCTKFFCSDENFIFVPIPLHWRKKNNRGYNQSEELSLFLSKKLNKPTLNLIIRKVFTKPQATLKKIDRLKNLENAFEIDKTICNKILCDTKIILVDDIYTTGTTMKNAQLVLKNYGFTNICGLVLSRGL